MRKIISVITLAVYSLVLAHSFIPHHHHSEFTSETQNCTYEKPRALSCCDHGSHIEHSETIIANCNVDHHSNSDHTHGFCSFDEKVVLNKGNSLSALFLPSVEIGFHKLEQNQNSFSDTCISIKVLDPYCRDVQLRGPPQFS